MYTHSWLSVISVWYNEDGKNNRFQLVSGIFVSIDFRLLFTKQNSNVDTIFKNVALLCLLEATIVKFQSFLFSYQVFSLFLSKHWWFQHSDEPRWIYAKFYVTWTGWSWSYHILSWSWQSERFVCHGWSICSILESICNIMHKQ